MNTIKQEIKDYRPKFETLLNYFIKKLSADRLRYEVNSDVHQENPLSCDWIILVTLVICAFMFWL